MHNNILRLKAFFTGYDQAINANRNLKDSSAYSFDEFIQFLQLTHFDLSLIQEDIKGGYVGPGDYQSLTRFNEIFTAMSLKHKQVDKKVIMQEFEIQQYNLMR